MVKVSPKMSAQNQNLKKLRHGFVDEKAMNAITLISSCQENPCTFLLAKEKTWKRILTLTMNYRQISQKSNLCHPKQH